MSHEKMADKLSNFISAEELEIVCQHYSNHLLPQMFSSFFDQKYQLGYIGIDMMMIKDPTMPLGYRLHPCIEMNVRCTMGVVARLLFDRFIHPEAYGQYIIEYSKETKFLMIFATSIFSLSRKVQVALQKSSTTVRKYFALGTL